MPEESPIEKTLAELARNLEREGWMESARDVRTAAFLIKDFRADLARMRSTLKVILKAADDTLENRDRAEQ